MGVRPKQTEDFGIRLYFHFYHSRPSSNMASFATAATLGYVESDDYLDVVSFGSQAYYINSKVLLLHFISLADIQGLFRDFYIGGAMDPGNVHKARWSSRSKATD